MAIKPPPGKAPGLKWNGRAFVPAKKAPPVSQARNPVVTALLQPPAPPAAPAAPPATGPYQGAAGSEAQNPGRQRTPLPDWADPNSPNYERRNYYVQADGTTVAREPGYYNPDNPFDTGRPGEQQGEFRGSWDPSMERRMDEPGITPWGPGGKAEKPGVFPAPGGKPSPAGAQHPAVPKNILDALLNPTQTGAAMGELPQAQGMTQLPDGLMAFIQALMGKIPPRIPPRAPGNVE